MDQFPQPSGKGKRRSDGGMTRRQQKRQPHVEREEKRDEREEYREQYRLWYEANKPLIDEVAAAYRVRKENPENYARYEELYDRLRATNCPEQPGDEYHKSSEAPVFWRNLQRIRDGQLGDYSVLVDYLRRDPYRSSSGYTKQSICRILKRAELSETEKDQIREVILQVAASPWARREFVEYARLAAAKLGTPEFRAALEKIDGWKARLVLERLEQADRMRASREAKETPS